MKKLVGVAVLVCLASMFAVAGEAPKPEVFGGYQFTSTDGGWHGSGFSTSANFYIWKGLGVTGDLGSGFSQGQSRCFAQTLGGPGDKRDFSRERLCSRHCRIVTSLRGQS